jgi:Tol biopolymer transport system component
VVISPDGQYLIYYELTAHVVYRVPLAGGNPEEVYTFEGTENSVNYDPDGNYLVLYNAIEQGVNHLVLLDQGLVPVFETNSLGSSNLVFSEDGHYLAWLERVNEGLVLNVTDLQTGETTLISDAAAYYRAELLPESNQILYIQYAGTNDKAGELMIANLDGTGATRLDMAVTSYELTGEGELLYWKVDAVEFTSTLNRIGLDGSGLVEVMGPEPGVCAFIR